MDIQLLENNLTQKVIKRLATLKRAELELHHQLSTTVSYHPRTELNVKLPRKLRKVLILWVRRDELPVSIRVSVEQAWEKKQKNLSPEEVLVLDRFRKLSFDQTKSVRWLGRLEQLYLEALGEVKIYLSYPKKPKRTVRRRGYRDGRGSGKSSHSTDSEAARSADRSYELGKKHLYQESVQKELAAASVILLREASGESAQAISAEPSAAQEEANEARLLADAAWSSESDPLDSWEEEARAFFEDESPKSNSLRSILHKAEGNK